MKDAAWYAMHPAYFVSTFYYKYRHAKTYKWTVRHLVAPTVLLQFTRKRND